MMFDAIDSVYLAVTDLAAACRPYERLGLRLSPARDSRSTLHVGGPANLLAVHFLTDAGREGPLAQPLRRALAAGRSLFAVALRIADLDAVLGRLETRGVQAMRFHQDGDDEMAWLLLHDQGGTDLVLVRHARPVQD